MLNRCGYWLFPASVTLCDRAKAGETIPFVLTLENRGVAPPYHPYELRVKLAGEGSDWVLGVAKAQRSWLPGQPIVVRAELPLPTDLKPGRYQLSIGLFDVTETQVRPVEFALQAAIRDAEGYYRVATLQLSSTP